MWFVIFHYINLAVKDLWVCFNDMDRKEGKSCHQNVIAITAWFFVFWERKRFGSDVVEEKSNKIT